MNTAELNEKLSKVRGKQAREDQEHKLEHIEQEKRWRKLDEFKQQQVMPRLRPATVADYKKWLTGFLEQGGNITHCYDYLMPNDFFVAIADFNLGDFCGSAAIQVIVPRGIHFLGGNVGHCNLYLMDSYKLIGWWVPIYSDINFG